MPPFHARRYDAPTKVDLPFNIVGLVAFELFAMHFVETKRGLDFQKPGSQVILIMMSEISACPFMSTCEQFDEQLWFVETAESTGGSVAGC